MSQTYGRSASVCVLRCVVKLFFLAKVAKHISQLKGRSPLWDRRWTVRFDREVNSTLHSSHWKRLPMWLIWMWLFKLSRCLKLRSHSSHSGKRNSNHSKVEFRQLMWSHTERFVVEMAQHVPFQSADYFERCRTFTTLERLLDRIWKFFLNGSDNVNFHQMGFHLGDSGKWLLTDVALKRFVMFVSHMLADATLEFELL